MEIRKTLLATLLLTVFVSALSPLHAARSRRSKKRSRAKKIALEKVLPKHFGFGTSWFGATKDWHIKTYKDGIKWDYIYTYIFPACKKYGSGTSEQYLGWMWKRAKACKAVPIHSMYGLLCIGQERGYKGRESDIVGKLVRDKAGMKKYFEETIRLMKICSKYDGYGIFHVEPDSWAFLEWHNTEGVNSKNEYRAKHDAHKCPVMVKSTGLKSVKDFKDTASGFGKALIHLRDLHAPNMLMAFHAKDCRAGAVPERTVEFIKELGDWDILIGDGIGHVYDSRKGEWWKTFSEKRFERYMKWYGTVTKEIGLPYIHWQSVVGKSDYTLLEKYPKKERVSDYMKKAGAVAVVFDVRGNPEEYAEKNTSDGNHGYGGALAPVGHPARGGITMLLKRLSAYYKKPMKLPKSALK